MKVAIAAILIGITASSSSLATTVTVETGAPVGGFVTTTITVKPGAGESIRDFHIRPTGNNSKVPKGEDVTFGGPTGWSSVDSGAWRNWGSGNGSSDPIEGPPDGAATFTIKVPASLVTYSTFKWRATNNGSTQTPGSDSAGNVVSHGTSSPNQTIPFSSISLTGPGTGPLGQTLTFLAENPISTSETLTYTVLFSRSLNSTDSGRVDLGNMVPAAAGFGLSTNSRTGTVTPSEGMRTAVYYGDALNHVIVDIPNNSALLGQTYYLQVEWSDGNMSPPRPITFVSS